METVSLENLHQRYATTKNQLNVQGNDKWFNYTFDFTLQVKVIIHDAGIIECLDQGNFPHPLSCRKFISCAKMEIGGVVGWEYTCPKGLRWIINETNSHFSISIKS